MCVLVNGAGSRRSGGQRSREFWGICGFAVALGSLLMFKIVFCFAGGLAWDVFHWSLLALGWSLDSV